MYRLAFALAVVLLLWVQSLFDTTTHTISGTRHVFAYGWLAWLFQGLFVAIILAFSGIAWRAMNDRLLAGLMLLGVPLFCFAVLPQTISERVELSDELLIHRREWPHTKYNADIPLDQIAAATEIKAESGTFRTEYLVGYRITTKDGRQFDLPRNVVLTAAHEIIDRELAIRKIPLTIEILERPK